MNNSNLTYNYKTTNLQSYSTEHLPQRPEPKFAATTTTATTTTTTTTTITTTTTTNTTAAVKIC